MPIISGPQCSIVLLEDNQDDLVFFQEALLNTGTPMRIRPFASADSAIAFFQRESPLSTNETTPPPSLFLCDYNLGTTKGSDIVPLVRAEPSWAALSIVMMSGSAEHDAVVRSYRAGANHFLQKPLLLARMEILVKTLYDCATSTNFGPLIQLAEYQPWPSSDSHQS